MNFYKYEREYYEFYNKYKETLLTNNDYLNCKKLIENNKDKYLLFEKNYDYIRNTNKILESKNDSLRLDINQFADSVDFNDDTNNDLMNFSVEKNIIYNYSDIYLKPFKDPIDYMTNIIQYKKHHNWNNTNFLSKVKNQLQCGSCWAFSTTSAIETFMRFNNYSVDRLSEQQLVDCSIQNNGCSGGIMHKAMDYVINNNGLYSNEDYPYNGIDNNCTLLANITKVTGSNISSYEFIIPKSPLDIMISLTKSPIAIGLDANNFYFRFYKTGIIDLPSNFSKTLNHAVLLVGYDHDETGFYWIIQNSWGETWGENGFCKLRMKDNLESEGTLMCQVYGVYPTK
jgi:C1A family cysteine protease